MKSYALYELRGECPWVKILTDGEKYSLFVSNMLGSLGTDVREVGIHAINSRINYNVPIGREEFIAELDQILTWCYFGTHQSKLLSVLKWMPNK